MMAQPDQFELYDIWKVCDCGHRWLGKSFLKPALDQPAATAMCNRCVRKKEAELKRLLERPRARLVHADPTAGQDQPYETRRVRLA